jgi:glucose-6-phosphate-specific signal transduction histidine kinase
VSYLASYLLVAKVISPIQSQYILNTELVSLLFLPHGVRVLTCVLYGPRLGAFYLFAATLLTGFWVGRIGDYDPLTLTLLYAVGALSVPLAFIFLEFIHEDTKIGLTKVKHNTIKTIAYLALISSILNSIGHALVLDGFSASEVKPRIILQFLIGDLLGTMVLFLCLRFVLNRIKLS